MFKQKQITSFSKIKLKLSGMRITEVYEIICNGDEAELSQYWLSYENHKDNYNLHKRMTVPAVEVIRVMNECEVFKWDGFNGKNPPGILDGTMFDFKATVNGECRIYASGSNNYPKHFHNFNKALYNWLKRSN